MMGVLMRIVTLCLIFCISTGYGKPPKKILGGMNAMPGEFPYQVSLRYHGHHICGGSIIDELHILTAAHCVFNPNGTVNTNVKVLTGTIDQSNETSGEIHDVLRTIYHTYYDPSDSNNNDITILKLTKPIVFNWRQRPIDLPVITDIPPTAKLAASGWGYVSVPPTSLPQFLQKLIVYNVPQKDCQKYHVKKIYENHICVLTSGKKGLCIYDSGSPLMYGGQLVGIVSWGKPCALGTPDVVLRVHNYVPWIKSVIKAF